MQANKALLQVVVDYSIPHLTLKSTIGLTQNPRVVVAATTGQKGVVAGAEATYDTNKGNVTTWNAGAGYNAADFQAHVLVTNAGMLSLGESAASFFSGITQASFADIIDVVSTGLEH